MNSITFVFDFVGLFRIEYNAILLAVMQVCFRFYLVLPHTLSAIFCLHFEVQSFIYDQMTADLLSIIADDLRSLFIFSRSLLQSKQFN